MRNILKLSVAGALLILGIGSVPERAQAAQIGEVNAVRVGLYGAPPGAGSAMKFVRDQVVLNERLKTGNGAGAVIKFLDDTLLTLGERSEIVIDKYIYSPSSNDGASLFKISRGAMRFVSGNMKPEKVRIETPGAIIGIRGSEAVITVLADGSTVVNCFSGVFTIRAKSSGGVIQITRNQRVAISVSGNIRDVENTQALPLQDEVLIFGVDGIGGSSSEGDSQDSGGGGGY